MEKSDFHSAEVLELSPLQCFEIWRDKSPAMQAGRSWPSMSMEELSAFEVFPGCPIGGDQIVIPVNFMPAGAARRFGSRRVSAWDGLSEQARLDPARAPVVLHALRVIMMAGLFVPRESRARRGFLPKPQTWVIFCRRLFRFSKWVLTHRPSDTTVFQHLSLDDCAAAVRATAPEVGWMVSEVTKLKKLGGVTDWPALPLTLEDVYALVSISKGTRANDGKIAKENNEEANFNTGRRGETTSNYREHRPYKPLTDSFVTEAGWRVLWFVENVGPNIVDLLGKRQSVGHEVMKSPKRKLRWETDAVGRWKWRDARGRALIELPFPISLRFRGSRKDLNLGRFEEVDCWQAVNALAYLLQLCHIFLVSMCMAARASEVFSLPRGCLEIVNEPIAEEFRRVHARVVGRTFKLVERHEGKLRAWPIHSVAGNAILQQERLVESLVSAPTASLWVQFVAGSTGFERNERGDALATVKLNRLVQSLNLGDKIDEDGLHHHRFRKTIARLAALAIVGAPKVLMDLFGHKSIQMTLEYILSDPDIAAEIEQVAQEMVLINAKMAIATGGNNGGSAGRRLNLFLGERAKRGETELGVKDVEEAARIITLNGKAWTLIREGVVCTKGPYQSGPCTRATGSPDPARCKVDCSHRLEHAAACADAHGVVSSLVSKLNNVEWNNEPSTLWLIGQLRFQLRRFEEVLETWRDNPVIKKLMQWEREKFSTQVK